MSFTSFHFILFYLFFAGGGGGGKSFEKVNDLIIIPCRSDNCLTIHGLKGAKWQQMQTWA